MILNELHQHVFKGRCDNPLYLPWDHTGDRFSIFGDKYILTLLNSMRNMEGNKDSRINKMSSFWLEIMKSILMVTILHD
ncbi:hypothetical protein BANRA_01728 [Escherichia coli]|nr:hypothetical protein BANRA_01728 [Escherichia coli]